MKPPSPSIVWEFQAQLGEGPVWDDREELLYWLDIKGRQLLALDMKSGNKNSIALPTEVGAIALRSHGGLIAATKNGFAQLNPASGELTFLIDPEAHLSNNRFNDGKCDNAGNFVAGTMDELEKKASGVMYRMGADCSVTSLFGGYVVCNGPTFSLDGRTLYFSNSAERKILQFDYDPTSATIGDSEVFACIPDSAGYPDGLTVDAEGFLWCAHWDGWRLTRFAPDGHVDQTIDFPVPHVTSCTFGGRGLDTLFATTARVGLDSKALSKAPLSGSLFSLKPGVLGLRAERFAG